jgi:hypothetical protein
VNPGDQVDWVNRDSESFRPYDIVLRRRAGGGGEADAGGALFVEVKTTGAADKRAFEMSLAELRFAVGNPGAYHIYRVALHHNADAADATGAAAGAWVGRPTARVRVVRDLPAALGSSPPLAKLLLQLE